MIDLRRTTALYATIAAVAGLAGAFASAGWTHDFVVLPIDDLIVELTPATIVNYMIQNVGEEAHYLHQTGAIAIAFGTFAAAAVAGLTVSRWTDRGLVGGAVSLVLVTGLSLFATGAAVPAVTAGVAAGTVVAVGAIDVRSPERTDRPVWSRRTAIGSIAGVISFSGIALIVGGLITDREIDVDEPLADERGRVASLLETADESALDSPHIDPPVSEIGDFYTVDITSAPPVIDRAAWTFTIRGAVEESITIDYNELREAERVDRFMALRCIGEDLNDTLLDTAVWSGTPIRSLLERAGPEGEYVELHSADGYESTFSIDHLWDGLLVYGMNGQLLPREHGHPVRVLMPDTWGKLNNKWITEIVIRVDPSEGYWEERGWSSEAPITAVAKLWTVEHLEAGAMEIGGHAYAGSRGVDRVEVSTDGGDTWDEAELADPLPDDDVTRQWRYRYEATEPHEVVVRTVDGEGAVQPSTESGSFPDGPSGWVRREIDPR